MRRLVFAVVVSLLCACPPEDEADGGGGGGGNGGGAAGGSGGEGGTDAGEAGGSGGDGGSTGGGSADAGLVDVFVAVGKQRRRAISCDDGRTWVHDNSVDDAWLEGDRYRCFSGDFTQSDGGVVSTDCDHNEWSVTSLTYAGGVFLHTMGWGTPGSIHRSLDGVAWQEVDTGRTAQAVMYDDGRFVLATRSSRFSDDQGGSWQELPTIAVTAADGGTIWNVRGGGAGGGVFVVTANDGDRRDLRFSDDQGATWQRPALADGGALDPCIPSRPVYGDGVFVGAREVSGNTTVCRSDDGAQTWTHSQLAANVESSLLWTGSEFIMWSAGQVHRSPDGASWTSTATQTRAPDGGLSSGPNPGAVAVAPSGTFVAVRGGWDVWYEQQRFYRSVDGVVWDRLPPEAFHGGHPVTAIVAGKVPSGVCP